MTASDCRFGFRIVGKTCEPRRLVDAAAAFAAHCRADTRCELDRECYLSAFWFAEDFRRHLEDTGSTAAFAGECWAPWLWFDLDNEANPEQAQADAGALAETLVSRYGIDPGGLLLFFSGSKGFHLGLPTALWSPVPSAGFHRTARRFAEVLAELAAVTIDAGVYDKVRAFRAPNSRHAKTGLHKRRLTFAELCGPLDAILEMATVPAPFDVPAPPQPSEAAAADWQAAAELVAHESEAKAARRANGNGCPTLNRSTLDFIREGATAGDRHRLLFSAACNLAEFACPPALAVALLTEAGLDSGLPPREVERQIECGLAHAGAHESHQNAAADTQAAAEGSTAAEPLKAATGNPGAIAGDSCQQVTGLPPPATADVQAKLTALWNRPKPLDATPSPVAASPCADGRHHFVDRPDASGIQVVCSICGKFQGYRPRGKQR